MLAVLAAREAQAGAQGAEELAVAGDEGGEVGHAAADYGDVDFDDAGAGISGTGGERRGEGSSTDLSM